MKCGHCRQEGVDVEHVKRCAAIGLDVTRTGFTLGAQHHEELRHSSDGDAIAVIVTEREVPNGFYTVVFDEERDDRVTLRIRDHWDEGAKARGERVIDYLFGPENTRDYKGFAFLTSRNEVRPWRAHSHADRLIRAANVVVRNPDDAGMAYALRSGNCRRCGRTLTVPASLHSGLGPVCAAGGVDR